MRQALSGAFIIVLLLAAITARNAHAAQPLTKVVMTTGSFSEREAAMYVAQDQGIFRRYGLDLSFVHVRTGPVGMAALAGGDTSSTKAPLPARCSALPLKGRISCSSPV